MICIACIFLYLAIHKGYEPYLLIPIAFGMLLVNLPLSGLMAEAVGDENGGLLYYLYLGTEYGIYPPLIFLCIGAGTDFGPLLANPRSLLLGAAAQLGIFVTFIGAIMLGFTGAEAASIGIIGGADGPTALYLTTRLAPHLLGPIAIAAYSYMALVPVIQPPIMRLLTTEATARGQSRGKNYISNRGHAVHRFDPSQRGSIDRYADAGKPTKRVRKGPPFGVSSSKFPYVYRLYPAWYDRRSESQCGSVFADRNSKDSSAGCDRIWLRNGRRCSAWQTHVQANAWKNQPFDRSCWSISGPYGGSSRSKRGAEVQPLQFLADARYGTKCCRRNWQCSGSGDADAFFRVAARAIQPVLCSGAASQICIMI